jgi:hypothetical protein
MAPKAKFVNQRQKSMSKKGTFDIPVSHYQSTNGARKAYEKIWDRPWPHDDKYLRELANRVAQIADNSVAKCEVLLNAMREQHEFETTH